VKVFVYLGHIEPRLATVKIFVFSCLVIFGHGYLCCMFLFFESFWPRLPMVNVFVYSWLFLAKVTNGESLFFEPFWQGCCKKTRPKKTHPGCFKKAHLKKNNKTYQKTHSLHFF